MEGGGLHTIHVDPTNIPPILQVSKAYSSYDHYLISDFQGYIAALITWALANTAVKISILHFYNTIFGASPPFRHVTYAVMALVVSFGVGNILLAFLICRPFAKNWNLLLPGTCGSTKDSVIATSIVNFIVDLIIISLPMPMIWRLQMAKTRKIALTTIFSLGGL